MIKLIWLLRRKPGVTLEQFKTHYETSHARKAQKYFGHLMSGYVRNYKFETAGGGDMQPMEWDYDCVAEWILPSEEALNEIWAIFANPEIYAEFKEDETHFLDSDACVMIKCRAQDICDTGTTLAKATA
jgi:hypothetical protein